MLNAMNDGDLRRDLVTTYLDLVDEADWLNAYFMVCGVFFEDVPEFVKLWNMLLRARTTVTDLNRLLDHPSSEVKRNVRQQIAVFNQMSALLKVNRQHWTTGFVGVRCSDEQLKNFALTIRHNGQIRLPKAEAEKHFDFTHLIPFWSQLPDYVEVVLGAGIGLSSPEFDLFQSMSWIYDEAVQLHSDLLLKKKRIEAEDFELKEAHEFQELSARLILLCRQVVLNAYLVIEAFINGLAHVFCSFADADLTQHQRLYLRELGIDNTGRERRRLISTEEKLVEWVKIMSPSGKTFDRGKEPFQSFRTLRQYRDSLVHFGKTKVGRLNEINFPAAKHAVETTLSIIDSVCGFVAKEGQPATLPFWLKRPGQDGLFRVSRTIKVEEYLGKVRPTEDNDCIRSTRSLSSSNKTV